MKEEKKMMPSHRCSPVAARRHRAPRSARSVFIGMSNIIQTRPHNRLRLSNAARFPVTNPRLKSARGTLADVIGSCPSSV
jgi:hypothetical protein